MKTFCGVQISVPLLSSYSISKTVEGADSAPITFWDFSQVHSLCSFWSGQIPVCFKTINAAILIMVIFLAALVPAWPAAPLNMVYALVGGWLLRDVLFLAVLPRVWLVKFSFVNSKMIFICALSRHLSLSLALQEAWPLWASTPDGLRLPGVYGLRRLCTGAARSRQLRPELFDPFLQWWVLNHRSCPPLFSLRLICYILGLFSCKGIWKFKNSSITSLVFLSIFCWVKLRSSSLSIVPLWCCL